MTARRSIALALLAAIAIVSAALAPAERRRADDGMCVPPTDDTTGWQRVQSGDISLLVPKSFSITVHSPGWVYVTNGSREIGLGRGDGPDELSTSGNVSLLNTCSTVIGGRPVTIQVLYFEVYDRPQAPTGNSGPKYVADARWGTFKGLPTVSAFILSNVRADLRKLRQVFYTADVGVKPPPPCRPQQPKPRADSVVDSAAVASRLSSDGKPWPPGTATLMLRFDSSGALGSMAVTAGDLPDSTKRSLAMIVGTNVRDQAAGAPASIELKVTSAAAGFGYEVMSATVCPP